MLENDEKKHEVVIYILKKYNGEKVVSNKPSKKKLIKVLLKILLEIKKVKFQMKKK